MAMWGRGRRALRCSGSAMRSGLCPRVQLSSHAGRAVVAGEPVAADLMARLIGGLEANGWLAGCDAVLSGYLGACRSGSGRRRGRARGEARQPGRALLPRSGVRRSGRAYAKRGVAEAMAKTLLPLADIVTPNAFELASLPSVPVRDPARRWTAARRLARPLVLATSVPDGPRIGTLAVAGDRGLARLHGPRLENVPAWRRRSPGRAVPRPPAAARSRENGIVAAAATVFHMLRQSVEAGSDEMPLVAEQQSIADAAGFDWRTERNFALRSSADPSCDHPPAFCDMTRMLT